MSAPLDSCPLNPDGDPPSSLLRAAQAGDVAGWRKLCDLFLCVVLRVAQRAGLQPEAAEDVAQEVFRAAWQNLVDFRSNGPGSFHAWLRTIAHHKATDHHRREQRQPASPGGSDFQQQLEQQPEPDEPPSAAEVREERLLVIRRALERISREFKPRTWQAFWRAVVDEQQTHVVADELGMTVANVRTAKSRVMRRLREELGGVVEGWA